ncbi:hypothetical protein Patl1_00985 [Pistacia atlantica]|uniref:Uncharacterized protein n=2 Tax=Pistacia TaxID=55512 RepID=A0ACC1CC21_9ROSI|nr:hypothetical protein Patl1_00985 [Pistacia atlantica]
MAEKPKVHDLPVESSKHGLSTTGPKYTLDKRLKSHLNEENISSLDASVGEHRQRDSRFIDPNESEKIRAVEHGPVLIIYSKYQVQDMPNSVTKIQLSKLDPRIANFISLIRNNNMMKQQIMGLGYDATSLTKDIYAKEDPLYSWYQCLQCELEPIEAESKEYSMFSGTKNRMLLWHGSRLTNWAGILSQGLRIAPPEAPGSGCDFGKGVYFSDMFSRSVGYCGANSKSPDAVLLLCEVALGDMNELLTLDCNADKLPKGKLSTKGVGKIAPDLSQAQVLEDGVIVPLGLPKEQSYPMVACRHNEYIVYNVEQIRMRYVVHAKFCYTSSGINLKKFQFQGRSCPIRRQRLIIEAQLTDTELKRNRLQKQHLMAQQAAIDQQLEQAAQSPREDMISCVSALEAALLPCLPARELQAIDRSPHPSHQIDVERHARDFMEAAKKLQLYFTSLQREDQPTKTEILRKEIAMMEEELKTKNEIINKQERLIQGWRNELKDQLNKHKTELERV